jgi:hypothetical protein
MRHVALDGRGPSDAWNESHVRPGDGGRSGRSEVATVRSREDSWTATARPRPSSSSNRDGSRRILRFKQPALVWMNPGRQLAFVKSHVQRPEREWIAVDQPDQCADSSPCIVA